MGSSRLRAAVAAAWLVGSIASAAEAEPSEQPMLVLEPGMHVAAISDLDLDQQLREARAANLLPATT